MTVLSTSEMPGKMPEAAPRERLLQAAGELFYAHGIRAVSVDQLAAAAHTNKMTLYRHFPSKDALVAEYLRMLAEQADAQWAVSTRDHPGDALAQLRDWISHMASADCRGCALANAAIELPEKNHPARAVIEEHKTRQRERLVSLCRAADFVEADRLADELFLLLEGARVNVQSVGQGGPGARYAEMATALIKSHARKGA